MQKRGILLITLLASINLVSAISIGEFLDVIGGENIILGGIFLISFFLINLGLSRFSSFEDITGKPTGTPTIISFILSIFIIYGIYKSNFDVENLLSGLGITGDILTLIIAVGIIYLLYKFKETLNWIWRNKCIILLFAGIACIAISLTDIVYEQETVLIIGIVLIVAWILCRRYLGKSKEKPEVPSTPGVEDEDRKRQKDLENQYKKEMEKAKKEIEDLKKKGATTSPELEESKRKLKEIRDRAQDEAIKENARREKAIARKAIPKPDYLKITMSKQAPANSTQNARVSWRGGLAPYGIQWSINNQPQGVLRDIKNQFSTAKIKIPDQKGKKIFVTAMVKDANNKVDVVQQEVEII